MASNTNKRVATKHIRDGIKSNYKRGTECEVCGTTHELEFHHYHSVALLLKNYARENNIPIGTDEEVLEMRQAFYDAHWFELVDDAATLCNTHHKRLHSIYGKEPELHTASKQRRWVVKQREKQSVKRGELPTQELLPQRIADSARQGGVSSQYKIPPGIIPGDYSKYILTQK